MKIRRTILIGSAERESHIATNTKSSYERNALFTYGTVLLHTNNSNEIVVAIRLWPLYVISALCRYSLDGVNES